MYSCAAADRPVLQLPAVPPAAARMVVVLLERWPTVGGTATNALVDIWHTSDRVKR